MEEKGGVRGATFEGIFFSEGAAAARVIKHVEVRIDLQNSNLRDVKKQLAQQAMACGANAIVNFRYGQKKQPLFNFRWDSEAWHGEGDAVRL